MRYDPAIIEPRLQTVWEEQGVFRTPTDRAELAARPTYDALRAGYLRGHHALGDWD